MISPAHKTALVLSGGGAYGAFGVGVMKVLFAGRSPATGYEPVEADIFTGTSVGSFNASVMVMQPNESSLETVVRLENIWLNSVAARPGRCGNGIFRIRGDPFQFLDPACLGSTRALASSLASDTLSLGRYFAVRGANFLASSTSLEDRLIGFLNVGSFIDSSPYGEMLNTVINHPGILNSTKKLKVIATNWLTGEAEIFDNSDFNSLLGCQSIMASTAIPGVFPPVSLKESLYVDGGVVMNTPLAPAINEGAETLHVIYLDPDPRDVPLMAEPNTVDTMLRVYNMMLAAKITQDTQTASWINQGLKSLEALEEGEQVSVSEAKNSVRVAKQLMKNMGGDPYVKVIIHRYFPRHQLGGALGMLNFNLDPIVQMIREGEIQALTHDCLKNGCLL